MIQIDMQMPTNCHDCPACNEYLTCAIPVNGRGWGENDVRDFSQSRPEWCPMKEQESWLGIQHTADSITFISTGTAQQGEARGLLLGKLAMHEWLKKELLYRGLLTNDIRAVFDEAERWGGR